MSVLRIWKYWFYKALSDCLLLTWAYLSYEVAQNKPIRNVSEKVNKLTCFPVNFENKITAILILQNRKKEWQCPFHFFWKWSESIQEDQLLTDQFHFLLYKVLRHKHLVPVWIPQGVRHIPRTSSCDTTVKTDLYLHNTCRPDHIFYSTSDGIRHSWFGFWVKH